MVKLLLESCTDVEKGCGSGVMLLAAADCNVDVMRLLIQHRGNVNCSIRSATRLSHGNDQTPLSYAVAAGGQRSRVILKMPPLSDEGSATVERSKELVELLLKERADVN